MGGDTSGTGSTVIPVSLKELEDTGINGQSAAVISYSWPRAQQDIPCGKPVSGNSQPIVEFAAPVGCIVYARIHVHWSSLGASNISTRYAVPSTKEKPS